MNFNVFASYYFSFILIFNRGPPKYEGISQKSYFCPQIKLDSCGDIKCTQL